MAKKEFNYMSVLDNEPNDWIVYKSEPGLPETQIGYRVELHHHGENAHRCSCEFGIRQTEGQKTKRCKHVNYVLDEVFKRMNK